MKFICFGFGGNTEDVYLKSIFKCLVKPGIVVHPFNTSAQEAQADYSVSSRPALCTYQVLGQLGLHNEILFKNKQTKKQKGAWHFKTTVL